LSSLYIPWLSWPVPLWLTSCLVDGQSHHHLHPRQTQASYSSYHLTILHMNVSSNILLSIARQCECHSWRERGAHDDYWIAHGCWHFLCWMLLTCGMEICNIILCLIFIAYKFYSLVNMVYWMILFKFCHSFSGGCTWEKPEVQGGEIHPWEVTDYCLWWLHSGSVC